MVYCWDSMEGQLPTAEDRESEADIREYLHFSLEQGKRILSGDLTFDVVSDQARDTLRTADEKRYALGPLRSEVESLLAKLPEAEIKNCRDKAAMFERKGDAANAASWRATADERAAKLKGKPGEVSQSEKRAS